MGTSIWTRLRGNTLGLYLLAGVLTWPAVTLVLYWGDRLTNALPGLGSTGPAIGFWAAGGYALIVSVVILVAGWVQSTLRSPN